MRARSTLLVVLAGLFVMACAEQPAGPDSPDDPGFKAAERGASGATLSSATTTDRHLVVFEDASGVPDGFADQVASLGGTVESTHEAIGGATVSGLDDAGTSNLARFDGVEIVEPELAVEMPEPRIGTAPQQVGEAAPASPSDPRAAFFFPRQWNMRAIDADDAWAEGALGSSDVTVAILDTGIGYTHPDLDGLVDLSRSASFVPEDDDLVETFFPGEHPVTDLHYHGTHVAATVASNGLAAAGVTSQTTLMGVKVCSVLTGRCRTDDVLAGILHAVDNGADIANLSLGGGFLKNDPEFRGFVAMINRAYNYANQQGTQIVVAANGARKPAHVRRGVIGTADDLGQPGTDPEYGKGRVNALEASR